MRGLTYVCGGHDSVDQAPVLSGPRIDEVARYLPRHRGAVEVTHGLGRWRVEAGCGG